MSDDAYQATTSSLADHEAIRPGVGIPASAPLREAPAFKRMLGSIPPSDKEILGDTDHGIAAVANGNAMKRSEARRDAILAVALAIKRRGENPVTDWTTRDTDTVYVIADLLAALS
jgi:hypothetical protein